MVQGITTWPGTVHLYWATPFGFVIVFMSLCKKKKKKADELHSSTAKPKWEQWGRCKGCRLTVVFMEGMCVSSCCPRLCTSVLIPTPPSAPIWQESMRTPPSCQETSGGTEEHGTKWEPSGNSWSNTATLWTHLNQRHINKKNKKAVDEIHQHEQRYLFYTYTFNQRWAPWLRIIFLSLLCTFVFFQNETFQLFFRRH